MYSDRENAQRTQCYRNSMANCKLAKLFISNCISRIIQLPLNRRCIRLENSGVFLGFLKLFGKETHCSRDCILLFGYAKIYFILLTHDAPLTHFTLMIDEKAYM